MTNPNLPAARIHGATWQRLLGRLRTVTIVAINIAVVTATIGVVVALIQAQRAARKQEVAELIYALRYAVARIEAELELGAQPDIGPFYPPLDACVRLDIERWRPCAWAVLGMSPRSGP